MYKHDYITTGYFLFIFETFDLILYVIFSLYDSSGQQNVHICNQHKFFANLSIHMTKYNEDLIFINFCDL